MKIKNKCRKKVKSELRKTYAVTLNPRTQRKGAKFAFQSNLSFSRFVESLILEYEKNFSSVESAQYE